MDASPPASPRLNWLLVVAGWAIVAAIVTGIAINGSATAPLLNDTDDAMRLVNVRDFLAGQGWYDHAQYRLNVPFGAEMTWSRLVDLPIAGLILLLQPIVGEGAATLAAYVWPLILLFVLMLASAKVALKLVGPEGLLAALVLPVLSPTVITEFLPGRLDHHNVQVILTLVMIWCTIEALDRPRWAIGAGFAAATALAVGAEAVPCVAAMIMAFGLMWVFRPEKAGTLAKFGLSFAIGTALHLAIAWPPSRWFEPACDAISFVYAATAAGVGVAFIILAVLPMRRAHALVRLGAGAVAGAIVLGAVVAAFPNCLSGPFAELDPWLVEIWASRIIEGRPIWRTFAAMPDFASAIALPLALGLAVVAYRVWRVSEDRDRWLVYGLYLALTVVITIVIVRGSRISGIVAVPAGAWLIAAARARYLETKSILAIGGLLGSWIAFSGIIIIVGVTAVQILVSGTGATGTAEAAGPPSDRVCLMPRAFDELAMLPEQRVMAPVDLGAHILAFTHHSVVAAPYPRNFQRNAEGIRDGFLFFSEPLDEARDILTARGITLVVACPQMVEKQTTDATSPDSFAALIRENRLPAWLREISAPDATLRIFDVEPAQ